MLTDQYVHWPHNHIIPLGKCQLFKRMLIMLWILQGVMVKITHNLENSFSKAIAILKIQMIPVPHQETLQSPHIIQ